MQKLVGQPISGQKAFRGTFFWLRCLVCQKWASMVPPSSSGWSWPRSWQRPSTWGKMFWLAEAGEEGGAGMAKPGPEPGIHQQCSSFWALEELVCTASRCYRWIQKSSCCLRERSHTTSHDWLLLATILFWKRSSSGSWPEALLSHSSRIEAVDHLWLFGMSCSLAGSGSVEAA